MKDEEVQFETMPSDALEPDEHESVYDVDTPWEFRERMREYPRGGYKCVPAGSRVEHALWSIEKRVRYQNARAERRGAVGELTEREWLDIQAAFDCKCAYCGDPIRNPIMEHVVPVSRGGSTTRVNIVPACWGCNQAKGTKTASEWLGVDAYRRFEQRIAEARQKGKTRRA